MSVVRETQQLQLLQIPSRSFGEREIATYGELSHDHNPIHSDRDFAAKTPFGHPIVYGFLFVMPVWEALQKTFGSNVLSSSKSSIRFLRPLLVGQTASYSVRVLETDDAPNVIVTIATDGADPIAVVEITTRALGQRGEVP